MSEPVFEPEPLEAAETPAPAAEPAAEPTPESFQVDQAQWEATQNFMSNAAPVLGYLAQMIQTGQLGGQQQAPEPEPQQQLPELDPFDPQSIANYVDQVAEAKAQSLMEQQLGPYSGYLDSVAAREGETVARAELEQIRGEVGDFDVDAALVLSAGLIEQNMDPRAALRVSAQYLNEFEQKVRTHERERYIQEIGGLQNVPSEGPIGGAAAEMEKVPTGPKRYEEAIARAMSRRNPQMPVG